ncbi:GyrI-like domain-containing protein [Muriicola sp.]|uniref:GyrI-like domain-containing protein n=1 Tax=Muriicola sp. TaxID=2020856 RepID=UPI003C74FFE4
MENMEPTIKILAETKLAGMHINMSFANNKTFELWRRFMTRKTSIPGIQGPELYSVEVYTSLDYFHQFDPNRTYEKWAAVKVKDITQIPEGIDTMVIPEGFYAVFTYNGLAKDAWKTYQYIYGVWIPNSRYNLDLRPHVAVMGEKYKKDDPSSEEELWIPVRK